jgi:hypothetical protein
MIPGPTPDTAPRWPTLFALVIAVAGVHLALLVGPVSWSSAAASPQVLTAAASEPPGERTAIAAEGPATANPPLARVSTVRWIVPAPLPEPAPVRVKTPPPRKSPPVPSAEPTKTVRAVTPVPVVVPVPAPAPAAEAVPDVNTTASGAAPGSGDTAPIESAAPSEPTAAAPLPEVEPASDTSALGEPTPAPDAEWETAAAVQKRTPGPAAPRALPPAQPPGSTLLDYAVTGRIKGIAYNAEGQLNWTLADGRYSARMEMKVFLLGSRVQTSTGRVGPSGLSPERFADKSRSEKAAHFDAQTRRIRFSNNAPEAELLPGAQDRLSLFLQIAGLLQARPQAYANGQTIEMPVVGTGDADIWRFVVGDEVTLSLPAGEMRARQIKRLPRKEFDSTVEMWLAPALQHLPVRLRVTQANGDVADQQLSRMP